jgi:hypothetical protein
VGKDCTTRRQAVKLQDHGTANSFSPLAQAPQVGILAMGDYSQNSQAAHHGAGKGFPEKAPVGKKVCKST